MPEIELSVGTIEYEDTGGPGPTVLLLHGLLMDTTLWTETIAGLSADHRCVAPTLPMGAHRRPVHDDADLSLPGLARLVTELLDKLDLHDVTVVGNDTGGALVQLMIGDAAPRVGRAVLVSCEAFDNLPPGLSGRTLVLAADHLAGFDRPALVVWAKGDRVMPPEHGVRLAALLPQGTLVEVDDSYTLVPLDQPAVLADHIRDFVRTT
jgi:pimeloyl-ACP methyl ester carboxylesterase